MATIPATTECHFTKPNTKSTTAQIEKKARGVGRFISPALCSTLHNLGDSNRKRLGVDECDGDISTAIVGRRWNYAMADANCVPALAKV